MKASNRTVSNRRLAGLEVLGVDVYVSRKPLAQAQLSRIVTVAVQVPDLVPQPDWQNAKQAATRAASQSGIARQSSLPARNPAGRALFGGAEGSADTLLPTDSRKRERIGEADDSAATISGPAADAANFETEPAAAGVASRAVAFNLLMVTFAPGVLFVSDIRQAPLAPALESGVLAFLHDVMGAIGRPQQSGDVAVEYFQWPLVRRPGIDASEVRARDVFDGLLGRKLRESDADLVVVMGRTAHRYVNIDLEQGGRSATRIVYSEALGRLFSVPTRKDGLWRALCQASIARA